MKRAVGFGKRLPVVAALTLVAFSVFAQERQPPHYGIYKATGAYWVITDDGQYDGTYWGWPTDHLITIRRNEETNRTEVWEMYNGEWENITIIPLQRGRVRWMAGAAHYEVFHQPPADWFLQIIHYDDMAPDADDYIVDFEYIEW